MSSYKIFGLIYVSDLGFMTPAIKKLLNIIVNNIVPNFVPKKMRETRCVYHKDKILCINDIDFSLYSARLLCKNLKLIDYLIYFVEICHNTTRSVKQKVILFYR